MQPNSKLFNANVTQNCPFTVLYLTAWDVIRC